MKRRVRIYKAGGQHSAYLTRAQEGMQMAPVEQQAPAPTAEDVMTYMMQLISNGSSLDEATQAVVGQGIPADQATMIANQIDDYIQQQADANLAQETGDEDSEEKLALEQQAQEQAAAEEEARAARIQAMYAQDETDYTGSTEDDSDIYMKLGGVKSKRDYIKNYMSLAKKQMGGGTEQAKPDLRTDVPFNGRTEHLQKFLGAVKTTAQDAALKKQAEDAYNQQMQSMAQEGGMYPSQDEDPENPMHHLGLYSQGLNEVFDNDMLTQAQFGGRLFNGRGQQRRAMRRMNRMFPVGMVPQGAMFPQGFNINNLNAFIPQGGLPNGQSTAIPQGFGGYGLANIDVRRTGLFGRPKEYTINFNTAAPVQPKEAEDLIEQATTNAEETVKEEAEATKAAETNTSSTTNTKVQEEAAKTGDVQTADGATAEVKAKDKSNTGKTTRDTVPGITPAETETPPAGSSVVGTVIDNYHNAQKGAPKEKDIDNQYLPGKPEYNYFREDGKWYFNKVNPDGTYTNKQYPVTNQESLARLNEGPMSGKGSKGSTLITLKNKPGYYYRETNTGDYVKFKGDPKKHSSTSKPIATIKKGDKNYNYIKNSDQYFAANIQQGLLAEKALKAQIAKTKQVQAQQAQQAMGNMVNPIVGAANWLFSPSDSGGGDNIGYQMGGFTDPNSGLYKFFAGGEDPSIPQISQDDIDYMHSVNTTDPYFAYGGYFAEGGDNAPVDILDAKGNVVRRGTQAEAERAGLNHRLVQEDLKTNLSTREDNTEPQRDNMTPREGEPGYNSSYPMYNQYPRIYPRAYGAGRAIRYAGSWDKQKGSPYMTGTNNPYMGQLGPGSAITSIDVKRSGMFGAPKKYTINYSVPGQSGINANKPQSYKGSDGQMHFMNTSNANQQAPGTADGRESRLKSMYRRMTEKGFSTPEEAGSTGLHDKNDEKYKKIYGHYPGEQANGRPELPEMGKLATKPLDEAAPINNQVIRNQADLNPERYSDLPQMETRDQGMLNLPDMVNERVAQSFPSPNAPQQQAAEDLSPVVNTAGPRVGMEDYTGFGDYQDPVMPEADYVQDSLQITGNPYNFGMDTAPTDEEMAAYLQNNLTPGQAQFEYPTFPHFNDPSQYINMPVERRQPIRSRNNTVPVNTSNKVPQNQAPLTEQQFIDQANKYGWNGREVQQKWNDYKKWAKKNPANKGFNSFVNPEHASDAEAIAKQQIANNNANIRNKSNQVGVDDSTRNIYKILLENPGANKIQIEAMEKMYPALKRIYRRAQYGGDLVKAQKLGEFNYSGNDLPFGYFKDPNTGKIRNLAGDTYKPTTNLQGNAEKLMNTNDLVSQGNGLTTDKSMGFDASGEQYRNDGLLSDAEKEQQARQNVSVDVKRKKMWDVNGPLLNEKINRVGNSIAGVLEKIGSLDANKELYNNFDADRLYAVNQDRDRGTHDTNSGLFRPDEMGFKGVAALGGYMEEGGYYEEGGDTYMSEDEIRQFLADGGELEFI